jgi:hypothetical protein
MGFSEVVILRRTDNTIVKRKGTKRQNKCIFIILWKNNDRKNINIKIRKSKNKDKKANEAYDHHCTTKVN